MASEFMPFGEGYREFVYNPEIHGPPWPNTWQHVCKLQQGNEVTAKWCIVAYFKFETRPGFYEDGPCEDPRRDTPMVVRTMTCRWIVSLVDELKRENKLIDWCGGKTWR